MTSPFESHDAFQLACKTFIARYPFPPDTSASATAQDLPGPSRTNRGWQWVEHKASVPERSQVLCALCSREPETALRNERGEHLPRTFR
jgi:hypothetical protein